LHEKGSRLKLLISARENDEQRETIVEEAAAPVSHRQKQGDGLECHVAVKEAVATARSTPAVSDVEFLGRLVS